MPRPTHALFRRPNIWEAVPVIKLLIRVAKFGTNVQNISTNRKGKTKTTGILSRNKTLD